MKTTIQSGLICILAVVFLAIMLGFKGGCAITHPGSHDSRRAVEPEPNRKTARYHGRANGNEVVRKIKRDPVSNTAKVLSLEELKEIRGTMEGVCKPELFDSKGILSNQAISQVGLSHEQAEKVQTLCYELRNRARNSLLRHFAPSPDYMDAPDVLEAYVIDPFDDEFGVSFDAFIEGLETVAGREKARELGEMTPLGYLAMGGENRTIVRVIAPRDVIDVNGVVLGKAVFNSITCEERNPDTGRITAISEGPPQKFNEKYLDIFAVAPK